MTFHYFFQFNLPDFRNPSDVQFPRKSIPLGCPISKETNTPRMSDFQGNQYLSDVRFTRKLIPLGRPISSTWGVQTISGKAHCFQRHQSIDWKWTPNRHNLRVIFDNPILGSTKINSIKLHWNCWIIQSVKFLQVKISSIMHSYRLLTLIVYLGQSSIQTYTGKFHLISNPLSSKLLH